jgi:hypothetical protein
MPAESRRSCRKPQEPPYRPRRTDRLDYRPGVIRIAKIGDIAAIKGRPALMAMTASGLFLVS